MPKIKRCVVKLDTLQGIGWNGDSCEWCGRHIENGTFASITYDDMRVNGKSNDKNVWDARENVYCSGKCRTEGERN